MVCFHQSTLWKRPSKQSQSLQRWRGQRQLVYRWCSTLRSSGPLTWPRAVPMMPSSPCRRGNWCCSARTTLGCVLTCLQSMNLVASLKILSSVQRSLFPEMNSSSNRFSLKANSGYELEHVPKLAWFDIIYSGLLQPFNPWNGIHKGEKWVNLHLYLPNLPPFNLGWPGSNLFLEIGKPINQWRTPMRWFPFT